MGYKQAVFPYDDIMRDMNMIVRFNPPAYSCLAESGPVYRIPRSDFYVIIYPDNARVGDFDMFSAVLRKSETVASYNRPRVDYHPAAYYAPVKHGHAGEDFHIISDRDIISYV